MTLHIQIGCATPQKQMLVSCAIAEGATVEAAILRSQILKHFPEIDLTQHKVGVFGKVVSLSQVLAEGDRVEIYRPLARDPKKARKLRAAT